MRDPSRLSAFVEQLLDFQLGEPAMVPQQSLDATGIEEAPDGIIAATVVGFEPNLCVDDAVRVCE